MRSLLNIKLRSLLQKAVCLAGLALLFWHPVHSQDSLQSFKESLFLQTDRDIYVVGEQVWMKVFKLDAHENKPDNFSKVVYIELLNQAGNPVNQLKLHVPEKSGSASFSLSDTLSSGNYLLRAYTSWMKNYPAGDFSFRTISVINPFRSIEGIGEQRSLRVSGFTDSSDVIRIDEGLLLELSFDTTSYSTREQVKVDIQARDIAGNPVEADLFVTIARSSLFNDHRANIQDYLHPASREEPGSTPYLPELEGVVISGTILSSLTNRPIDNEDIVLSIVGKAARCQVYRTNDKGEFYFNIDDSGVLEIVIQPVDTAVNDYYIELVPDFHVAYDHPLPGHFYLDPNKIEALNQGIINMQIQKIYKAYRDPYHPRAIDSHDPGIYGEPEYQIQMSDYISLRNIREVIKEIVPSVAIRVKDGLTIFKVESGIENQVFDNKPLVLVDGVPFDELDQILNIPVTELERIEVINLRYILNAYMFDGIIHFITKKGKMAGLEFDHAVFRQAYAAFSEESCFSSPVYSSDSLKSSPIPDFRNTLYWNPNLSTGEDGQSGFEFYTADEIGEYLVIVEGISPEGKTGFLYKKLLVH